MSLQNIDNFSTLPMFIITSGYPCNLIKYQMHVFKAPLEEYKGREGA